MQDDSSQVVRFLCVVDNEIASGQDLRFRIAIARQFPPAANLLVKGERDGLVAVDDGSETAYRKLNLGFEERPLGRKMAYGL
jgi:hypothetical protein